MIPVNAVAAGSGGHAPAWPASQFRLRAAACPGCAAPPVPCQARAAVMRWELRQREQEHPQVLAWPRDVASCPVAARAESDHQMVMVTLGPARAQAPWFRP